MGKPTSKLGRKLTKKMDRVVSRCNADESGSSVAQSSSSTAAVPQAALPASIPTDVSMMTRRERMLTSAFAKKEKTRSIKERKLAATSGDKATSKRGDGRQKKTTVVDVEDSEGGSKKKMIGALLKKSTQRQPTERHDSRNHESNPGGRSMLKASAAQRHDAFVKELNLFTRVSQMPTFQQDPFAAIETHLDATMSTLKPQTADIGRRPEAQRMHARGYQQQQQYPQRQQNFRH